MTIPLWCLVIAVFIPYVLTGMGAYYRKQQFGMIDNHYPRTQATQFEGAGARVYAAQANAWEALAVFAAAVIVAHLAGANPAQSANAAMLFVVARVLHGALYWKDIAAMRTLAFIVGLGSCIWLFSLAVMA